MTELDGVWELTRTGGLLPPLRGVTKRISGARGETRIGRLAGVPFRVEGLSLRYPAAFVDVLSPRPDGGYDGSATVFGRRYGTFRMQRAGS